MKLPHRTTVQKWTSVFDFNTGINSTIMEGLRNVVNNYTAEERNCVIMWDEMSTKEYIQYNKHLDLLEGIVDFGKVGRSLEAATEVLVFMLKGINHNWRFPISYYFSRHNTTAAILEKLVQENIAAAEEVGLRVRMGICDMAFTNQSLYKKWEIRPESPFRFFSGRKIYFGHDSPHLIKLVRNNLMKHNLEITTKTGKKISSSRVKWLHVLSFFGKDRRLTTRMAPKLTTAHVYLKDYAKMKVKLATQVLSRTVSAGMLSMVKLKLLKQDVSITAKFIRVCNDMFDLLNMSKFSRDTPTRRSRDLFGKLSKFEFYYKYFKSVEVYKSVRRADFLKGIDLTLKAVGSLCADLKAEGYAYVNTRDLQQDCLENYFSAVRQKGGFNRNPTTVQFKTTFRCLFFAKVLGNPGTGNTEANFDSLCSGMVQVKDAILHNTTTIESETNDNENNPTTKSNPARVFFGVKTNRRLTLGTEQMECAMEYFGAAVVSAIAKQYKCTSCKSLVVSKSNGSLDKTLINEKEHNHKMLGFLTEESEKIFFWLDSAFEEMLTKSLNLDGSKICKSLLDIIVANPDIRSWLNHPCNLHRVSMIKYYLRCKLYRLCKDKNETIRKVKSWKQTRRELRNQ